MGKLRINRKKVLWIMVGSCLLFVPIFITYEYYHDVIWVRLKLLQLAGVNNVELHGFDRGAHYHVSAVGFGIVGKPGSAILVNVYDTDKGLTGIPDHLYL